jgi:nucleotide sugar dehydrogenase
VFRDFSEYPKLVGGINSESGKKAQHFYESVLTFAERPDLGRQNGVWDLGTSEAAELAKLAETTYRDVNIALANQFAQYAEAIGLDIYKVIEACNSQPFSHIHSPGIAVGGHCIPVYPHFYLKGHPEATVVSESRKTNLRMPSHAVEKLRNELGDLAGMTVVVLGLAYRGGVKEHAFSGVFPIVNLLRQEGAIPLVHDPMFSDSEILQLGLTPYHFGQDTNAAILHTNHKEYLGITAADLPGAAVLIDGRNFSNSSTRASIKTYVLGVGG